MNKNVILNYWFMFDPAQTWATQREFEDTLGKFLAEHGMEAYFMDTVNGSHGPRVLQIVKKEIPNLSTEKRSVGRPLSTKGLVDKFTGRNRK